MTRAARGGSLLLATGPKVQSASVTNTASKNTSIASHARASARLGSGEKIAAVPTAPAITTGTAIGYNSTGSSTSRECTRTSIAAKSVPTDARPIVPVTSRPASSHGARPSGASNRPTMGTTIARRQTSAPRARAACRDRPPAARSARGAARSVSPCRSRSNARLSASVPAMSPSPRECRPPCHRGPALPARS